MKKNAVIVLPTYNEKDNIHALVKSISDVTKKILDWNISLLFVDDNSPDNTADEIKKIQKTYSFVHLIEGKKDGLGRAYIRGFKYAIEHLNPYVCFQMDSDLSHDAHLIPQFLDEIEKGADFVVGARYIKGGSIPSDWEIHRKIFSILGNTVIRFGFMDLKVHDWTSGYRCIKSWYLKEILNKMDTYNGYVFQVALLDKAIKLGLKVREIPLNFVDRKIGNSKINSIQYIINTLLYVLVNSSFIKFAAVGGFGFVIDSSILYLNLEKFHLSNWLSKLISAECAIISNFILNNFWTFSHKKIPHQVTLYIQQFAKFNFVSVGSIILQIVFFSGALYFFPTKITYVKLIYNALIIAFVIIPYSYIMYNKFIWKKK